MDSNIRVLILDEVVIGEQITRQAIGSFFKNSIITVVSSETEFTFALDSFKPDIIISDYLLSTFDGLSALKIARQHSSHIPFIFFSQSQSENIIVECIKAGADDYVSKGNITRLGTAIKNTIKKDSIRHHVDKDLLKFNDGEERYRAIVENSHDAIYIYRENKFLFVNNRACQLSGYSKEEFSAMNIWDLLHQEDRNHVYKLGKQRASGEKAATTYSARVITKSGNIKDCDFSVQQIQYLDGSAVIGSIRDSTSRKQAERKSKKRETYLITLNLAKEILLTTSADNVFSEFVNILGAASDASRTYIFLNHKNDRDELLMSQKAEYCAQGISPEIDNPALQNLSYNEFFERWHKTLKEGDIISGKIQSFPKGEKEFLALRNIQAILVIPIRINSEFIGFIGFDNCISDREWDNAERTFLSAAANDLTQYIGKKRDMEHLNAANTFAKKLLETTNSIILTLDKEANISSFNKYAEQLTGYSKEEVLDKNWFDIFITNKDKSDVISIFNQDIFGKSHRYSQNENEIRLKNGENRVISWNNSPILSSTGEAIGVLSIGSDITKRKNAEILLKRNFEFQKLISTISSSFVGIYDLDDSINALLQSVGEFSEASRSYIFLLSDDGKTMNNSHEWCADGIVCQKEHLQNQPIGNFHRWIKSFKRDESICINDVSELSDSLKSEREILESQDIKSLIAMPMNVFGTFIGFIGFDNVKEKIVWSDEVIKILTISSEILSNSIHSNRANKIIIASEQKYRTLTENLSLGVYRTSSVGKKSSFVEINPAFLNILGYQNRAELLNQDVEEIYCCPEDRLQVVDELNKSGVLSDREVWLKKRDGTKILCNINTVVVNDENNKTIYFDGILEDITERKRVEKELKDQEERYRKLFEENPLSLLEEDWSEVKDIIDKLKSSGIKLSEKYFDDNPEELYRCLYALKVKDINVSTLKLHGFSDKADFLNNIQAIYTDKTIHTLKRGLVALANDSLFFQEETEFYDKEKNIISVIVQFQVITDYSNIICSVTDITEMKKLYKKLQESQDRFYAISKATNEGIIFIENDYIIEANEAALRLSGCSYDNFVGRKIMDFIAPESVETVLKNVKNSYSKPYDGLAKRDDGSTFYTEFQGRTIEHEGRTVRVSAIRDISQRKENEILLEKSREKLRTINSRLRDLVKEEVEKRREKESMILVQSKQAAMGEMIGNIAHQWRQPLNEVGIHIQNIRDSYEYNELSAESLHSTVEKTMDKLDYMSQTIEDFRNFFRSDHKNVNFYLSDSIKRALLLTQAAFESSSIKIILDIDEDIQLLGHPNAFSQAILNILNNAKDVLDEKKIEKPFVKIVLCRKNGTILLTISNNGGQIPVNIIDRIFEPYFSTKGTVTGTGLGLYITQTIIERNMPGRLSVRNIPEGVEFQIEFR